MMLVPSGVRVHIALGVTDMRKGLDGLAMLVQEVLKQDPFSGHLFAFRGRKANLIKIVFWDGTGLCLFTKRLTWLSDIDEISSDTILLTAGLKPGEADVLIGGPPCQPFSKSG